MSTIQEFWRNGHRYFTIDLDDGEARMCLSQCKNYPSKDSINLTVYGVDGLPLAKVFYVDFIRVSPQYRNRGYGRELLQACLSWANSTYNIIILDAIPLDDKVDSHRLIRFYLENGFKLSKYKNNQTAMYFHNRKTKRIRKPKAHSNEP